MSKSKTLTKKNMQSLWLCLLKNFFWYLTSTGYWRRRENSMKGLANQKRMKCEEETALDGLIKKMVKRILHVASSACDDISWNNTEFVVKPYFQAISHLQPWEKQKNKNNKQTTRHLYFLTPMGMWTKCWSGKRENFMYRWSVNVKKQNTN